MNQYVCHAFSIKTRPPASMRSMEIPYTSPTNKGGAPMAPKEGGEAQAVALTWTAGPTGAVTMIGIAPAPAPAAAVTSASGATSSTDVAEI